MTGVPGGGDLTLSASHSTTTLPSGAVVHRWNASRPRGIVVLQHGFAEYAERFVTQYQRLIPCLIGSGFDVHALDLWGHGSSPGRRGLTSVHRAVRDHLAVREIASRSGLPVLLVGHSLGGLVTAGSVATDSAGTAGVVLMGPALPAEMPPVARRLLGAVAAGAPGWPIPFRRRPTSEVSRDRSVGASITADPAMFSGQVRLLTAATALDVMAEVRTAAVTWQVPTLIVHGTADTYTDPFQSQLFVEAIGAPDATLHLVDGGCHELLNDLCADDVLAEILSWLDDHARAATRPSA